MDTTAADATAASYGSLKYMHADGREDTVSFQRDECWRVHPSIAGDTYSDLDEVIEWAFEHDREMRMSGFQLVELTGVALAFNLLSREGTVVAQSRSFHRNFFGRNDSIETVTTRMIRDSEGNYRVEVIYSDQPGKSSLCVIDGQAESLWNYGTVHDCLVAQGWHTTTSETPLGRFPLAASKIPAVYL